MLNHHRKGVVHELHTAGAVSYKVYEIIRKKASVIFHKAFSGHRHVTPAAASAIWSGLLHICAARNVLPGAKGTSSLYQARNFHLYLHISAVIHIV